MRPKHNTLTPQELEIMKLVWQRDDATVRDVYEVLLDLGSCRSRATGNPKPPISPAGGRRAMFSAPSSEADSKNDHRYEYEGDSYTDRLAGSETLAAFPFIP